MENMENVMNEEAMATEETAAATGSNLGGKILGGVLITGAVVGVVTLARRGYKWAKSKVQARKDRKAAALVEGVEHAEVDEIEVQ